jgi:iron(III) transport system ATP-binding protein
VENDEAATVKKMLQLIKMEAYAHAYPSQLSGGQEQRVALARTLATNPELLLLDEPFSNLDAALKSELRQEIWQIVKKIGTSMIFITHDFFDAIDIADEIIFLKDGVVLQHDVITDFSKNIQDMEVKNTLSDLETNAERMLSFLQRGG